MYHRAVVALCALAVMLAGCASTPKEPKTPNKYGHHFEYSYQTPPQVSEADADECGRRANDAAFASASKISDRAGVLFGAIGAVVQIARVKKKLNDTYEEVIKSCLVEKGYDLAEGEKA